MNEAGEDEADVDGPPAQAALKPMQMKVTSPAVLWALRTSGVISRGREGWNGILD